MTKASTTCLLWSASVLAMLASAQAAGTPTLTARQDSGNPLETLASIGQVGLSLLGSFLGQNTPTPTTTVVQTITVESTVATSTSTPTTSPTTTASASATTTQASSTTARTSSTATPTSSTRSSSSTTALAQKTTSSGSITSSSLVASPTAKSTSNGSSSQHTTNTLAIALGVVGGVLALALLALLIWFCCRRRRRRRVRPDSPLSDSSDLGEKALMARDSSGSTSTSGIPSLQEQLRSPLLQNAGFAAAAAAGRSSTASTSPHNSWGKRSPPSPGQRMSHDSFADTPTSYNGAAMNLGQHPSPTSPRKDPRSWTPVVSSAHSPWDAADAHTPLVPPVAPLRPDSSADESEEHAVFLAQPPRGNGALSPVQEERDDHHRPAYTDDGGEDGYVARPSPTRRYSGGSAWQPPSGSVQRPRSTPLSPLAQLPMSPEGVDGGKNNGRGGPVRHISQLLGQGRSSYPAAVATNY